MRRKTKPKMIANLLINKYLTDKSLFLKDLAGCIKSLISKDHIQRGPAN